MFCKLKRWSKTSGFYLQPLNSFGEEEGKPLVEDPDNVSILPEVDRTIDFGEETGKFKVALMASESGDFGSISVEDLLKPRDSIEDRFPNITGTLRALLLVREERDGAVLSARHQASPSPIDAQQSTVRLRCQEVRRRHPRGRALA